MKTEEPQQHEGQRIFISDCEGPISKNDNAFELASYFVPDGNKFFALVSKYDDVLADVVKKTGYKAGDTLKLILPFLKAYGATNEKIREYSSKHVLLVPGAKETLQFVKSIMPSFIVSTSYEHYMTSLCNFTRFPCDNVYCTRLNIDKYEVEESEKKRIRELCGEISAMPMIDIPEAAESLLDFSERDQKNLRRLDEIFGRELPRMKSGRMLKEVNPVGGYEKANAVQDVVQRMKNRVKNVMYVGDSITDVSPFILVKRNLGLTVSFNGNKYAIREAEIAILSGNTIVTSVLANTFNERGRDAAIKLVKEWGYPALKKYVEPVLRTHLIELYPTDLPQVELITDKNVERLSRESSTFRKTVRGEAVGRLG